MLARNEDRALLRSVTNALAVLEAFSLERPELGALVPLVRDAARGASLALGFRGSRA